MNIRETTEADLNDMLNVEVRAFGPDEGREIADLVDALLHDLTAAPVLSLLAFDGKAAIGHLLFTKARVSGPESALRAVILAPLAVVPIKQRQGIGTQLVREGLRLLSGSGTDLVFVLGHPEYYPRFGFRPAGKLGFAAPYPIPPEHEDAWMVLELQQGVIDSVSGTVMCAEALNQPEHWRE